MFTRAVGALVVVLLALTLPAVPATAAKSGRADKIVYLTFDDGPESRNNVRLLKILRREAVPATFFLVGSKVAADRKAATRLWLAGHAVGNHTYSHLDLSRLDYGGVHHQLHAAQRLLGPAAGKCMRPPYGAVSPAVYSAAGNLGLRPVLWTVDPQDWAHQDTGYIVNHVLSHVHDRAVVLLHDGGGDRSATVSAVAHLIPQLRARGYEFRSLAACRVPLSGRGTGVARERKAPRPQPTPVPTPTPTPVPTVTPSPEPVPSSTAGQLQHVRARA